MTARIVWGFSLLAVMTACADAEQSPPTGRVEGTTASEEESSTTRSYERNLVFASLEGDSVFIVPWMIRTVAASDLVVRDGWAWLARGGVWAPFYAERWSTPPTREPARIVPHRGLRLLVRDGDGIDGIIFEEGQRSLEIIVGDGVASWTGPRGGSYEVLTGSAYLLDQRVDGMVLDMARASVGALPPGGDWAFLLSGDSARFVLVADSEHGGEVAPLYRGWGDHDGNDMQWPEVRIDWRRTEAFPPARRDVPVAWRVWSSDDLLGGALEAVSAELQPGPGPGPLLPVRGLFEVVGELSTVEGTFPVRGILVHERR